VVAKYLENHMPIPDYQGSTFVAFVDISGFKEMMKNEELAVKALDHFYSKGFEVLQKNTSIHGAFISDCAILYVNTHDSPAMQLPPLLEVVEELNRNVLEHNIMLATSIAHGRFSYRQRVEFEGIEKNLIFGNAYLAAFLDTETSRPKIHPGECRIVKHNIDPSNLAGIPRIEDRDGHYYFFWMLNDAHQIDMFKSRYNDAYQQKYRGMLEALKDAANNRLNLSETRDGSSSEP
jgi:hypothetical protein